MTQKESIQFSFLRLMGIGVFRRYFMKTIGRISDGAITTNNYRIVDITKENLIKFKKYLLFNEVVHWSSFLWCMWCLNDNFYFNLTVAFLNIPLILMQRYNRIRVNKVLKLRYA